MLPVSQLEIAAYQGVQVQQQVAVKGGGNAQCIVIGGLQQRARFEQVHADQQAAAIACSARLLQEHQRVFRREIANARAWVKQHLGALAGLRWQLQTA